MVRGESERVRQVRGQVNGQESERVRQVRGQMNRLGIKGTGWAVMRDRLGR